MSPTSLEVTVEGRQLKLSNMDKVLYPSVGFTKGQVIDYYTRVAPVLLPHLRRRALTLKRYPNGVDGHSFYEKNCPSHRPAWVETVAVWSERNKADVNYCLANDLPTLVWVANLASLELHTSLSHADDIERPTMLVFDLDPGAPADMVQCAQVGLVLREMLDDLGLACFPKTSGSKGLQLYAPLNSPASYEGPDGTKLFAHAVARRIEADQPRLVVSQMAKEVRKGKVFIDWSQNDSAKTTVCVYSLRARERPTVSTPLTWEEVETVAEKEDPGLVVFEAEDVLDRVSRHGDLFAPVAEMEQSLPAPPET
ncbi:MAG TPA: non-homologous end-joining DNA ligase [Acidimicrobiales bacterium]|nr:non-homologous end-joining DNA ligase [Acidimicrobiales bacterium]